MTLSDAKKRKLSNKYAPATLFLETYNYDVSFENEELTNTRKMKNWLIQQEVKNLLIYDQFHH